MAPPLRPAYAFAPEEHPLFPGSPYTPRHAAGRRAGYACLAALCGVASSLVGAIVTVDLPALAGSAGLYVAEAAWLPAVYVAFNATANLTLVRARFRFGLPPVMMALLALYAAASLVQLAWPTWPAALAGRAACGLAAAVLSTMAITYLQQVFSPAARPLALLVGISVPQLGIPLARLLPIEALAIHAWRGLHLLELALISGVAALALALPLPPSDRARGFEPLDALTIGLLVPAAVLVCGVLAVGRYAWWTDAPWIGLALTAAVPLLAGAFVVEHLRPRPLIQTRWIGTGEVVRIAVVASAVRLALGEQTYGSVGLLSLGGLSNDQLHTLFAAVAIAMTAGATAAVVTISPARIPFQILAAALVIALGAWLDTDVNGLTRAPQLYASQMLIAFGTTLFIGPAILFGYMRVVERGADHLVTFTVLFSATQNVGGLAGSALLGTWQVVRERHHATLLAQTLVAADPMVAERIRLGGASLAGVVADPAARGAQGTALLVQSMVREANILAFADVFRLVALLALATAAVVGALIARRRLIASQGRKA